MIGYGMRMRRQVRFCQRRVSFNMAFSGNDSCIDDIIGDFPSVWEDLPEMEGKITPNSTEVFCICNGVETSTMIACDSPKCTVEWFHYGCVGIDLHCGNMISIPYMQPESLSAPWYFFVHGLTPFKVESLLMTGPRDNMIRLCVVLLPLTALVVSVMTSSSSVTMNWTVKMAQTKLTVIHVNQDTFDAIIAIAIQIIGYVMGIKIVKITLMKRIAQPQRWLPMV
ncbi:uncharacterized protein [Ptychodera flava]|uniref:uncharacterized protein n=1 Tax=Ptychodera flava TaxID=63121 RepID=UPI00396A2B11